MTRQFYTAVNLQRVRIVILGETGERTDDGGFGSAAFNDRASSGEDNRRRSGSSAKNRSPGGGGDNDAFDDDERRHSSSGFLGRDRSGGASQGGRSEGGSLGADRRSGRQSMEARERAAGWEPQAEVRALELYLGICTMKGASGLDLEVRTQNIGIYELRDLSQMTGGDDDGDEEGGGGAAQRGSSGGSGNSPAGSMLSTKDKKARKRKKPQRVLGPSYLDSLCSDQPLDLNKWVGRQRMSTTAQLVYKLQNSMYFKSHIIDIDSTVVLAAMPSILLLTRFFVAPFTVSGG